MDVHAPEKPVLTVKEALAHLAIVTVGILIALSFEVRVDLSADSRTTAEITGAFGFMDYDDVKRYAAAYDYQALYRRTQDQALDHLMAVTSGGLGLDFQKASPSQLEQLKDRLRLATGSVLAMTEFGQTLTSVYDTGLREAD